MLRGSSILNPYKTLVQARNLHDSKLKLHLTWKANEEYLLTDLFKQFKHTLIHAFAENHHKVVHDRFMTEELDGQKPRYKVAIRIKKEVNISILKYQSVFLLIQMFDPIIDNLVPSSKIKHLGC